MRPRAQPDESKYTIQQPKEAGYKYRKDTLRASFIPLDVHGRSYTLSVLLVIFRVNYFFSEGAVPPGTVPSNFRISPFCPTAQPW